MKLHSLVTVGAILAAFGSSATDRWYQNQNLSGSGTQQTVLKDMSYWSKEGIPGSGAPTSNDDLISAGDGQNDYFNLRMYGVAFTGNSLQIGENDKYAEVTHVYGELSFAAGSGGLILHKGGWAFNRTKAYEFKISGPVRVEATAAHPFNFTMSDLSQAQYSLSATFSGPFSGDGDAVLVFGPRPWSNQDCASNVTFNVTGLEDYAGTIVATSSFENVGANYGMRLRLGSTTSACHVDVCRGASLMTKANTDVAQIGSVTLRNGSRLWVTGTSASALGLIRATGKVAVEDGPVPVKIDFDMYSDAGYRVPILAGSASDSSFTEADFILDGKSTCTVRDAPASFGAAYLEADVDDETGLLTLYLVSPGIASQTSRYTNEERNGETSAGSSLTNAAAWSNGIAPYSTTSRTAYYTANYLRTLHAPESDYAFPNDEYPCESLWLKGGHLRLTVSSFTVPRLYVTGASSIGLTLDAPERVLVNAKRFELTGRNLTLNAYVGQTLVLNGEIAGTAPIEMRGWSGTGSPQAYYELTGTNDNFKGEILVTQDEYRENIASFNAKYPRLLVSDGRNLGGRMDEFDPRALTLNHMAQMIVTNAESVTLADGLNRGVYIKEKGRFFTDAGKTLIVEWPVLMGGKLWKEGEGTLVLAGYAKHEESDAGALTDVPRAGSNLFEVVAGTVKIRNADALAGVETTVDDGASLQLVLDSEDPDLVKYGIRNITTDTPFAVTGDGKLPFSVDASGIAAPGEHDVVSNALMTVTDAAAVGLRRILPRRLHVWNDFSSRVIELHQENGLTTFALVTGKFGLAITVR